MTPKLYKDGDDYYYVVSMSEKIHHFFIGFSSLMGGATDDMSAPVVAVALITKNTDEDPTGGDPRKLILDANGGTLTDEKGVTNKTQYNKDIASRNDLSESTRLPNKSSINLTKTDAGKSQTFLYWNTKVDGSGTNYSNEQVFSVEALNTLFGTRTEVTLYAQWQPPDDNPIVVPPTVVEEIEDVKNENVIVGNWEVQNWYKGSTDSRNKFEELFGSKLYVNAWNMFQDRNAHYKNGDLYRTEKIIIQDNVVLKDPNATGDKRYISDNVSYGLVGEKDDNGSHLEKKDWDNSELESSVQRTRAAVNRFVDKSSYVYNQDGYPYAWQDLDSIDVDFQPEVSFDATSPYLTKDWDLELGSDKPNNQHQTGDGHPNVGVGTQKHKKAIGNGEELGGWKDHLRIHSSINFGAPYKARAADRRETAGLPDILWARIESEPMLRYPDSSDPYTKLNLDIRGLSSVRQIILSFMESNFNTPTQEYRPYIIFYDGPERYPDTPDENKHIRDSKPVIINFKADTNAIIYAPNSPVVILDDGENFIGKNPKYQFRGFIVAKSYVRLKTTEDFEAEIELYDKYSEKGKTGYVRKKEEKNPYFGTEHKDKDGNLIKTRDNGEPEYINWTYTKIVNPDNGIEMYVDDYGNVQYMPLDEIPTKYGEYETFGRTNFTSHGYQVAPSSANNLLLSGK